MFWSTGAVTVGGATSGSADSSGRPGTRVGRLVNDAANPVNGQSLVDVPGPIIEAVRPDGQVVDGVELVLLPSAEAGMFYGLPIQADLAWMADRPTGHPWRCFEQPLDLRNE